MDWIELGNSVGAAAAASATYVRGRITGHRKASRAVETELAECRRETENLRRRLDIVWELIFEHDTIQVRPRHKPPEKGDD